jgi:hypothetical protein
MNAALQEIFDRTVVLAREDPRVLAGYRSGSMGTEHEDAWSDVDPVFIVRDYAFDAFDRDLPDLFTRAGVIPVMWWPERINCDTLKNYAVFFHHNGLLIQYDITIEAASRHPVRRFPPGRVLFDKAGVIEVEDTARMMQGFAPDRLLWTVEIYWIYAYILGKYLRRNDPFKTAAAQQELFQSHVTILHALKPDVPFDWWPILAKRVADAEDRDTLLTYLRHTDRDGVLDVLHKQLAAFSQAARRACAAWDQEYPEPFASAVTAHLEEIIRELQR